MAYLLLSAAKLTWLVVKMALHGKGTGLSRTDFCR